MFEISFPCNEIVTEQADDLSGRQWTYKIGRKPTGCLSQIIRQSNKSQCPFSPMKKYPINICKVTGPNSEYKIKVRSFECLRIFSKV